MRQEVLNYNPILPSNGNSFKFQQPDPHSMLDLYQITGFPSTQQGKNAHTAVLRGSTAALMSPEGRMNFRTRKSDVDIYAITEHANQIGAGYFNYQIHLPDQSRPREIDILFFTPQRLRDEQRTRYRTFLTTKLVQPGWTILNEEQHTRYKVQSCEELIQRGATRRSLKYLTPSGAARLLLEEDLYAEPWRWSSMKTYFVDSPYSDRQRAQLVNFANLALKTLVEEGRAKDVTQSYRDPQESIYEITDYGSRFYNHPKIDRVRTVWNFVYDQLALLAFSRQGLSPDNFIRVLMKFQSVLTNPVMNYSADIILSHPKSRRRIPTYSHL